ncbi:19542_t:CDS:2 [Funneliformis geosporum]|uniref:19542_t:CDS:1 n=1 Tax=Funneliformis geosporum TaxID=1117311 RepID=A0A9W4SJS4_9GLOM|nr:19542_t:CDS:2 [Funneliformis geosporum]
MYDESSDMAEKRGFIDDTYRRKRPHDGKPITMIESSPNGEFIVTYSEKDNTVVGWNVGNEVGILEPIKDKEDDSHIIHIEHNKEKKIVRMCVSNEKILAYSNVEYGLRVSTELKSEKEGIHEYLKIVDMDKNKKKELYFKYFLDLFYCSFNSKEEFILYGVDGDIDEHNIIWVYSTNGNRWKCKKIYTVPKISELISISKFNKIWLRSVEHINEWNIKSKETTIISTITRGIKTRDIRISDYDKYTCIKIMNKVIVYSNDMGIPIPIASLDLNDESKLYKFMKNTPELNCLLLTLIDHKSNKKILDYITTRCRKICIDQLNNSTLSTNEYVDEDLPNFPCIFYRESKDNVESKDTVESEVMVESKSYIFLVVEGYVWKFQFDKIVTDFLLEIKTNAYDDVFAESWMTYFDRDDRHDKFENPFIQDLNIDKNELLREGQIPKKTINHKFDDKDIRLEIFTLKEFIGLRVINVKNDEIICELSNKTKYEKEVLVVEEIKIFKNKHIVLSTNIGVFIFYLEKNKLSLDYFQYIHHQLKKQVKLKRLQNFMFFNTLVDNKEFPIDGWVSYVNNDRENFLKYGAALLIFAIDVHDLKLVDDIYKKCLDCFKQDLENNKAFLTVINTSMPFLKKSYPEYLLSYYYANVDESRRKVNELIKNDEWRPEEFPEMKKNLLKILDVQ